MERSETISELAKALSAFQGELKPAIKSEENPFFKSKYADLASVWDTVRDPLAKNGLSVTQTLDNDPIKENILIVETTLLHSSGEWLSSSLKMPIVKNDAQAIGSLISYARRYSLSAILGVSAEDDDVEETTDHEKVEKAQDAKVEHWCVKHNIAFRKQTGKDGLSHWYSHRLPDGSWCNEQTTGARDNPKDMSGEGEIIKPVGAVTTQPSQWPPKSSLEQEVVKQPPETLGIDIDAILEEMVRKGQKTAGEQRAWIARTFPGTAVSGKLAEIIGKLSPEQQQALCSKLNELAEPS